MIEAPELRSQDMYGNRIWPLGETGFGVSVTWYSRPSDRDPRLRPSFTFFHASDGFRQAIWSLQGDDDPGLVNLFQDRWAEVVQLFRPGA